MNNLINNEANKSAETKSSGTVPSIDLERERFELDKQRLRLETESHETSRKQEAERLILEKSKERTAKLQISLPILVSILALAFSSIGEYRRSAEAQNLQRLQYELQYNQAVSSYNQTRIELFKRLTERTTDSAEVKKTFAEVFPNDYKELEKEQRLAQPK